MRCSCLQLLDGLYNNRTSVKPFFLLKKKKKERKKERKENEEIKIRIHCFAAYPFAYGIPPD
jgi:hypothetical protein